MSARRSNGTIDQERLTRWYNAQARFYSARRDIFDGGHVRAVVDRLERDVALRVLDAGCGSGLFAIGLGRVCPGWRITGIDPAAGLLDLGRRRAEAEGLAHVTFESGDAEALRFADAEFDVAIAAGLLPNLNDPRRVFGEIRRVLRPGGRVFVVEIDRQALSFADRLSFRAMVWGYRAISSILPRFKFAHGWSLERSTIAPARIETLLVESGFESLSLTRADKHLIVEAVARG